MTEDKEIKFDKALERLEKIVEDLETGNISLEDALKKYEEGVQLSRICQTKLAAAEKKIEVLTKTLDGSYATAPFDPEDENLSSSEGKRESRVKPKKTAAKSKELSSDDEELML